MDAAYARALQIKEEIMANPERTPAAALSAESTNELIRRVNAEQAMAASLYACREPGDLELAQAYSDKVRDFYAESATQGAGMLFYIR
jgi:hypothetical protein